jgi:hypothetical protein
MWGVLSLVLKASHQIETNRSRTLIKVKSGFETRPLSFTNLPEARRGQWGEGLTTEQMDKYRWLRPRLVATELITWNGPPRITCGIQGSQDWQNNSYFIHPERMTMQPIQDRPVTRVTSIRFFHIFLRWSLL